MTSFSITTLPVAAVAPVKAPVTSTYVAPVRKDTSAMPLLDRTTLPSSTFWTVLGQALTLRREHGSQTEGWFVAWLCARLPVSSIDAAGNLYVDLRCKDTDRSMFTAHTDSVHRGGGDNEVLVDGDMWRAGAGAALGADDGAGIAIMCHMIEAGVPGLYVFFRGEECGGIGSGWASAEMPEAFADLDRAIAFDRAGYYDVITHQSGGRCCSQEFALALADALSTETRWYQPCDGGVYTDTAEFTSLIPECTNVSVGYKNQHGDREEQDVDFLWQLAQQCVAVQWDDLPTKRDPKVKESRYSAYAAFDDGHDWLNYDKRHNAPPTLSNPATIYDADEDDLLDPLEANLWVALEDAMRSPPSYGRLVSMICAQAWPEEPNLARKQLQMKNLDEEALDIAVEMLDTGWPAAQVLDELWTMVSP